MKIDSWQKCPVCEGFGFTGVGFPTGTPCTVCHGQKIISTLTGSPPNNYVYTTTASTEIIIPEPKDKDDL